jgi:RNA polymerase sigma-70 factor (ECF subfamily)
MEAGDLIDHEPEGSRSSPFGFESFFRANYAVVVHIAHSVVGDSHAAQDVAQDVFIAAQRRFPEPEGSAHATAWVRIAAVHAGLNAIRGRRRRDDRHLRSGVAVAPAGPEEVVLERVSQQEVRDALAHLPRRAATVLVLRYSGLSYAEVSEAMGVGIGQVGTMLRRAEAALRKEIERATHS